MNRAAEVLEAQLRTRPEINGLVLGEPLKVSEKSWVFTALLEGRRVVVKRLLQDNSADLVLRLKRELTYLETVFPHGDFDANRCLFAWPEDGIVILSFAEGPQLGDAIALATGAARHQLLYQSGAWLKHYCATRTIERPFWPGQAMRKLAAKSLASVTAEADRKLLARLMANLRLRARATRGTPFVRAATHGDFVGINAHVSHGIICGVDIQGECWVAIARDVARFLVWLQIHDPIPPRAHRFGIRAEDVAAMLDSGVLDPGEHDTTLPFFIGTQFFSRFIGEYDRPDLRDATRTAIRNYLSAT